MIEAPAYRTLPDMIRAVAETYGDARPSPAACPTA
jgi:hypothetical protein